MENLSFSYRTEKPVLQNVSFEAVSGEITAILGNNGAGKSTLLKCLCRLLRPTRGTAEIDGEDMLKLPHNDAAKKIAFVPQEAPVPCLTVYDAVMLGRTPYIRWGLGEEDRRIVREVLARMKLEKAAVRFLPELSGGERQKVTLARSLAQNPKTLLLDEPTSNLDLKNQHEALTLVRTICAERGIAVIMAIHDINLALKYCDKFVLMRTNRVFACGGWEIITAENIEAVYDIPVRVYDMDGERLIVPEFRP
ncbi:MAG: ABC transporter ATP-binding protein [Spirochaetaceae bacterium]|nr:ABC transporter ATP-binding protein [Spirochaetaceae bacterium]